MADADLTWGGTLSLTPSGDLALSDGDTLTQQRILRRLLTAVRSYVWHQDYGAGLPQKIGNVARPIMIQSLVRSQIKLEATVAATPIPVVAVTEYTSSPGLFQIAISYTDAISGVPVNLKFEVPTSA